MEDRRIRIVEGCKVVLFYRVQDTNYEIALKILFHCCFLSRHTGCYLSMFETTSFKLEESSAK